MNDNTIDIRIKLSILWIAHFLIWTFADILRFIDTSAYYQDVSDLLLILVAAPLGAIQALLIVGNVFLGNERLLRYLNFGFGILFLLVDIGHIFDIFLQDLGVWEFELVAIYLLFDSLIVWTAYKWLPYDPEKLP